MLLVAALVLVPRLAIAMVPLLFMLGCLVVLVVLARPRTVRWRSLTLMMGLCASWALVVAVVTQWGAALSGVGPSDEGAVVGLAASFEEPGKLVPLAAVAVLAPGRMRRLAAVDWALLGFAAGAGFTIAEDGARRLAPLGVVEQSLGEHRVGYSLNPWTSGAFRVPEGGWLLSLLEPDGPQNYVGPMVVGHHASTMGVAMSIGLGIALWRTGRPWWRAAAWLLPLTMIALVVADHTAFNAAATWSRWSEEATAVPEWIRWVWLTTGQGHAQAPISMALFAWCLLADAWRRLRAGTLGETVPEAPRVPRVMSGAPASLRVPVQAVVALAVFSAGDLLVVLRAYGARGLSRSQRMVEGRLMASQVIGVRHDAMSATTPGMEPGARRRFALATTLLACAAVISCMIYGITITQAIGTSLRPGVGDLFFAALLDELARWWESMSLAEQILFTALAVAALASMGLAVPTALAAVGVMTWAFSHGHGLASFIGNPRAATRSYIANVTPGQLAADLGDFILTFVPGSALGLGGRAALRTSAQQLAAARTARTARAASQDLRTLSAQIDDGLAASQRLADQHAAHAAHRLAQRRLELSSLIEQHRSIRAQKAALKNRIQEILPPEFSTDKLTAYDIRDLIEKLEKRGAPPELTDELRDTMSQHTELHAYHPRLGEYIGERGGELTLTREGYRIPVDFQSTGPKVPGVGAGRVDGMAISPYEDAIVFPEYKGMSGRLPQTLFDTRFEGPAYQATPPYVRDRMLTDDRVARYFSQHPHLWEAVKEGRTTMYCEVLYTRGVDKIVREGRTPIALTPDLVREMDLAIAEISRQSP
ncbi:protease PrsW [Actinomyces capricornis]|uniref:protease PrsW n=1 Tax=Actinomyces capricornis TaxID=2755559 RepID=UPI001CC4605F|nr:protease PrsW [Actinomyces capricornis]